MTNEKTTILSPVINYKARMLQIVEYYSLSRNHFGNDTETMSNFITDLCITIALLVAFSLSLTYGSRLPMQADRAAYHNGHDSYGNHCVPTCEYYFCTSPEGHRCTGNAMCCSDCCKLFETGNQFCIEKWNCDN